MTRSLFVFGNGLGMALDSEYFKLSSGLASAWNATDTFTADHQRMVASAIPGVDEQRYPESEDQLDQLHMALVASKFLSDFERPDVVWLSDLSRELPKAFSRFVHAVAVHYHASGKHLPFAFTDALAEYIADTTSHVALLNYDNLLYDALRTKRLLRGYDGTLIDGFYKQTGFNRANLDRRNKADQLGWYLHLHGSPLFIGNRKLMGEDREFLDPSEDSHIVLTHVRHKPSIIDSSPVLREYWACLNRALDEAKKVILFGYSGDDLHLNEKIISGGSGKPVFVIEWAGTGEQATRERYWQRRLQGAKIGLIRLDNILEFRNWHELEL